MMVAVATLTMPLKRHRFARCPTEWATKDFFPHRPTGVSSAQSERGCHHGYGVVNNWNQRKGTKVKNHVNRVRRSEAKNSMKDMQCMINSPSTKGTRRRIVATLAVSPSERQECVSISPYLIRINPSVELPVIQDLDSAKFCKASTPTPRRAQASAQHTPAEQTPA